MNKNTATLRLTEPVIFLRTGSDSASQRRRRGRPDHPPALLRGLLSVKIVKPTRIKSVDVVFEGVARTDWPDVGGGLGTRRMEIHEENTFLSLKIVLFEGDQQRRSRTVGPGSFVDDRRSGLVDGVNHLTLAGEHTRGRKERRDVTDPETSQRVPLAARNGTEPPRLSSIHEAPLRPRLSIGEGPSGTNSDPTIPTTAQSNPSVNGLPDTPPRYSSLRSPSSRSATSETDPRSSRRRSSRISFTGMLNDVRELVQGHPSRHTIENEPAIPESPVEGQETREDLSRGRSRGRKDKGAIARLGEAFGIDMHEDGEGDEDPSWKELQPGQYNFPISFTLPSDLPPSIDSDYGSVQYRLKASVHRPGAFTPKLTASAAVELVTAPAEDDAEEGDAVVIERQWDMELRYLISVSGRNFSQGADIPWHVQLMPLSKMKLYRLTFMLEERIQYFVPQQCLSRTETIRRYQLSCIRHPQSLSNIKDVARNAPPLLPIWEGDPSKSSEAVLLPYADPPLSLIAQESEADRNSEALAHLLSPDGPWHLQGTLRVPLAYLQTTHKHKLSFVTIKHSLKIYLRVEKGDDDVDPKTGRKKQFDIIIETPVNILSKYCIPDWASLPPYEESEHPPLTHHEHHEETNVLNASRDSSRSDFRVPSTPMSPIVAAANISRPPSPISENARRSGASTPIEGKDPQRESRVQTSQRFANLMAGFEDEGGEYPPTYQSITGTPGTSQVIHANPLALAGARRQHSGSRNASRSRAGGSRNQSRNPDMTMSSLSSPTVR